jgi:hypothetical protein
MVAIPLELRLSEDKLNLLSDIARARQTEIKEVLEAVVLEWLEKEIRLQRARERFRQFSQGIAQGQPPHLSAREHDTHLYHKA